jgi:hypothetical protein
LRTSIINQPLKETSYLFVAACFLTLDAQRFLIYILFSFYGFIIAAEKIIVTRVDISGVIVTDSTLG